MRGPQRAQLVAAAPGVGLEQRAGTLTERWRQVARHREAEGVREIDNAREARIRVLGERQRQHQLDVLVQSDQLARCRRLLLHDLNERGHRVGRVECRHAGQGAVCDGTEGEDVGATIHAAHGTHLLGRHVVGCADEPAASERAVVAHDLGDAKVEHLPFAAAAAVGEEDVVRLDVAMNDPMLVGELESLTDLQQDRDDRPRVVLEDTGLEELVEVVAGEKFLDQVRNLVLDPEIEHQGDVGVDQVADELSLAEEPLPDLGVRSRTQLDRY